MNEEQKIKLAEALNGNNVSKKSYLEEAKDVINILKSYKNDMDGFQKYAASRNYGTPNLDKWYHPAAMYDATRGNLYRGLIAWGAGLGKEGKDFIKYTTKTYNPFYAGWESIKDLGRNLGGISASLFNPDLPVEQNKWINNLQTPTMRAIMPEYRGKNDKKIY